MDFFSKPPSYNNYVAKLMEIHAAFPFTKLFSIGQTVLGRKIFAIGVGNLSDATLFAGAFHAQEWLTTSLLVRFLEHLCFALREHTTIADISLNKSFMKKGLFIIPMVNPDGVSIALEGTKSAGGLAQYVENIQRKSTQSWQANARGIDLNHNFDAGFNELKKIEIAAGINSPAPRQFGGAFAASERETAALVRFLSCHSIHSAYAFHSQGEEIFYEYGENTAAQAKFLVTLFSKLSGYTPIKNTGLCSHGGFKDYFIQKYGNPAFTIEIGKGENPLPMEDLEDIYDKLRETMVAMTVLC